MPEAGLCLKYLRSIRGFRKEGEWLGRKWDLCKDSSHFAHGIVENSKGPRGPLDKQGNILENSQPFCLHRN